MTVPIPWSASLQAARTKNHDSTSASPVTFTPISPAPAIYTHAGNGNNYGAGRRNGRTVRLLIVHETEGGGLTDTIEQFYGSMQYEATRAELTSCTCLIGRTGQVGYDVPENDRPFTTGRWNDESLTIEVDGRATWTRDQWLQAPAQIEAVVDVLVDWCQRYDIPGDWLNAVDVAAGASPHGATPKQGAFRGITDHRTANAAAISLGESPATYSHTCPGDAFHQLLIDTIVPTVAARLGHVEPSPPTGGDMTVIEPHPFFDSRDPGGHGPFREDQTPLYMPVYINDALEVVTSGQCSIKIEAIDPQGGGFIAIGPGNLADDDVPRAAACNYDGRGIAQIVWPTRTDTAGAVKLWVRGAATNIRLSVVAD